MAPLSDRGGGRRSRWSAGNRAETHRCARSRRRCVHRRRGNAEGIDTVTTPKAPKSVRSTSSGVGRRSPNSRAATPGRRESPLDHQLPTVDFCRDAITPTCQSGGNVANRQNTSWLQAFSVSRYRKRSEYQRGLRLRNAGSGDGRTCVTGRVGLGGLARTSFTNVSKISPSVISRGTSIETRP
jgi:hypothetical protein